MYYTELVVTRRVKYNVLFLSINMFVFFICWLRKRREEVIDAGCWALRHFQVALMRWLGWTDAG